MAPSVLLAGAFGQHNPGDEALLAAFARELPGWRCVATTSDPAFTAGRADVDVVPARDRRAVARRAAAVDAVVLAGGTVFKRLPADSGRPPLSLLRSALALTLGARALGRPVGLLAVGAGRLDGAAARWLAHALVRTADLLVVRDEESAHTLARIGAPAPFRIGADAAWCLLEPPSATAGSRGDAVVVALGRHPDGRPSARRLADALAPIAQTGLRLRLQPWQVGDLGREGGVPHDEARADALLAELSRKGVAAEVVPPPADLADACMLFSGARLVLAMRFHATLAAAAAGVPFVAIAHEQKLAGIARRLGQPALSPDAPPQQMAATIAAALDHPPADPAVVRGEIETARAGFRLLRLLLSGGRSAEAEDVAALPLQPERWAA
ncbi:MAG: polysaccharide pyruvyl transferase CsaB [Conexibacter sp.]|nr:polysaccharide pyruvyl transferase CsaB [Conexibacter sp.]